MHLTVTLLVHDSSSASNTPNHTPARGVETSMGGNGWCHSGQVPEERVCRRVRLRRAPAARR
uniref:Uncharacterized protein n=1 Tax=uncultured organism TaxID=155900 RepID=A0A0G2YFR4_9ZZZZ|nr:hypothetical protein [uncultured organism]